MPELRERQVIFAGDIAQCLGHELLADTDTGPFSCTDLQLFHDQAVEYLLLNNRTGWQLFSTLPQLGNNGANIILKFAAHHHIIINDGDDIIDSFRRSDCGGECATEKESPQQGVSEKLFKYHLGCHEVCCCPMVMGVAYCSVL